MVRARITSELANSLVYCLKWTVNVLKYALSVFFHELIVVTRFFMLPICCTKCIFTRARVFTT